MKWILIVCAVTLVGCASKNDTKDAKGGKASSTAKASSSTNAEAKPAEGGKTLTCTNAKDVRSIQVVAAGAGCEVKYTKFGEAKSIASSIRGTSHCEGVMQRTQASLEKSGFSCQ